MPSMIHVLLIEDDPEHATLIRAHLARRHGSRVAIRTQESLAEGIADIDRQATDVILLDLILPDSPIDKTLGSVLPKAHGIPVIVLSSLEDEEFGFKAVQEGAQDYICKAWMDGETLFRSLRYAIERKTVEEQLRKANHMKDEFLATLSHELRTPIGVIQMFADILARNEGNEVERRQALAAIQRNAHLQASLISDLLDMSRIITGKFSLEQHPQNLNEIVREVVETVGLAASSKKIEVHLALDSEICSVLGDGVRLQQIFWNIVSNAIKFTPSGGTVDVKLARVGSQAEFTVTDNGEGISPDFLPYVFDRFRQEDASIRRRHGGLGLGLALVRYLVELHGGKVIARSMGRGHGSTFSVVLPLLPTATARGSLEGLRVLVVDDSPDTLMLLEYVLRARGATVTSATSAADGFRAFQKEIPDALVCDIGMPEEDGYMLMRRIRQLENEMGHKGVPAVALTAFTRDEDREQALKAGFQEHLPKPLNEQKLAEALLKLTKTRTPEAPL